LDRHKPAKAGDPNKAQGGASAEVERAPKRSEARSGTLGVAVKKAEPAKRVIEAAR
jgi:hypothetical protein